MIPPKHETTQQEYTRLWHKRTQLKQQIKQLTEEYEETQKKIIFLSEQIYNQLNTYTT